MKRPPIVLLRDESELLRRIAALERALPGEIIRRLIVGEAARQGLLERVAERGEKQAQEVKDG